MKNQINQSIELSLSAKEPICIKSKSCKLLLDIQNTSNNDIEVGGLNFVLRPYSTNSRINFSGYINSPVAVDTLENLQANQNNRLIIKANQRLEKEINIEQIKWLKSIQSSWKYNDLWERITEGKYQIYVELGLYAEETNSVPKKERIGNTEIEFIDSYKSTSNWLTLDFEEK